MNPDEVRVLLLSAFPEAEQVQAIGSGCNFQVVLVSESFQGLRTLARQQRVYAALNEQIASGAIHAVTMQTLTPDEWRVAQQPG